MQHPDPRRAPPDRAPRPRDEIGARAAGEGNLILGAVLAGGQSSRFGSDKARALFEDRPLVDHARSLLATHVDAVIVIGRGPGEIADLPGPGLGPLGGIAAALDHAAAHGYAAVITIGCDMPRLPDALIAALLVRAPSYCADAPVLGHWPADLAAQILTHIATAPNRSVRGWAQAVGAIPVRSPVPLPNVNTPADLAAL